MNREKKKKKRGGKGASFSEKKNHHSDAAISRATESRHGSKPNPVTENYDEKKTAISYQRGKNKLRCSKRDWGEIRRDFEENVLIIHTSAGLSDRTIG